MLIFSCKNGASYNGGSTKHRKYLLVRRLVGALEKFGQNLTLIHRNGLFTAFVNKQFSFLLKSELFLCLEYTFLN